MQRLFELVIYAEYDLPPHRPTLLSLERILNVVERERLIDDRFDDT